MEMWSNRILAKSLAITLSSSIAALTPSIGAIGIADPPSDSPNKLIGTMKAPLLHVSVFFTSLRAPHLHCCRVSASPRVSQATGAHLAFMPEDMRATTGGTIGWNVRDGRGQAELRL